MFALVRVPMCIHGYCGNIHGYCGNIHGCHVTLWWMYPSSALAQPILAIFGAAGAFLGHMQLIFCTFWCFLWLWGPILLHPGQPTGQACPVDCISV
ncbi:hypothetical protein GGX14DRAFT_453973 [Mycena pura]|uniref:Uncharacterized protein n=1 Tax=Mycena pura TaxID=153505 RepID=A0AAD6VBZ2_9AGAR|nr:hypothetical protein GGX14DRAFT_453973 [Mycena pura]